MRKDTRLVVGVDLGDRWSRVCVLDRRGGEICFDEDVGTTREALDELFAHLPRSTVAMEASCHSPWVSRHLARHGHDVIVADPRKLRAIWDTPRKNDRRDALMLAQLAASGLPLLSQVRHRDEPTHLALTELRLREVAVEARTKLINAVRGAVKSSGHRLPKCSAASFHRAVADALPEGLAPALRPLLASIETLTATIHGYDSRVEEMCARRPETARLREVCGVGPLTALAYVLVVGDPRRFKRSRDVGAYLGLVPRQDQSGATDRQLRISKAGDRMMRRLLVQAAHHLLGPFGKESDLRTWGLACAARGGKNGKKRAVVAVARKLAVLLHALWVKDEAYVPLRSSAA